MTNADLIRSFIDRFPKASIHALSRIIYSAHPERFRNVERCRWQVCQVMGKAGEKRRAETKDLAKRAYFRSPRTAAEWEEVVPPALEELPGWEPVAFNGPLRVLILSDVHLPYHSQTALKLAIQYGLDHRATMVLLNGDIVDCFSLSRWEKDPGKRDFPGEVRTGRQFLTGLRKTFPRAKLCWKAGNHEERFVSFLRMKAPELLGLPEFEWGSVFGLKDLGVQWVDGKRPIRLGKLNVIHGHEYRFAIQNPVNPARGLFLRAKDHGLCGHFHQSAHHSDKTIEGKIISCWSTGCLCNLTPEYAPLNPWGWGFAFVNVDASGGFHVENMRIVGGKVW